MARRRLLLGVLLAALALAAWCALYPYRLTDGDSCLYAALSHEMAAEGAWAAPTWAFQGRRSCFHEHPPGAWWPAALAESLGAGDGQAPLLANAFWLLALLAGTWSLAGGAAGLGAVAAAVLLLHYPSLRFTMRFGLELPFAACAVGALAAARSRHALSAVLLVLALGGAFLTKGAFALALPPLLALDAWRGRAQGARFLRLVLGGAGALLLVAGFDLLHRQAAGHGFWSAYLGKQVLPSLQPGGTVHPNEGSTLLYYGSRLLLYTTPWNVLVLVQLVRGLRARRAGRPVPHLLSVGARSDVVLAVAWILLFTLGTAVARREGSRYLFVVYPMTAWLTALALREPWMRLREPLRERAMLALLFLPLVLAAGKSLARERDAWWRSADALRAARPVLQGFAALEGPFSPDDDRMKQFLRHHAGVWAFAEPAAGAGAPRLRLQSPEDPRDAGSALVLETDLFVLLSARAD